VNKGPTKNLSWASNKSFLDNYKIHVSETSWIGTNFDAILDNDGTIDDLYSQINQLLNPLFSK
jgi:dephospho-CoA kinase